MQSNVYRSLLSENELFKSYIELTEAGNNGYEELGRNLSLSILNRIANGHIFESIIKQIPNSWYTPEFFNQILEMKNIDINISNRINCIAKNKMDKFSIDMQRVIKEKMLHEFEERINHIKLDGHRIDKYEWNNIKPYFPMNDVEYVKSMPEKIQIYYWYDQFNNDNENKNMALKELIKLFNSMQNISDIEYLPIEAYSEVKEKMPYPSRYEYTKKALSYLRNRYKNHLDINKYKEELKEAYLFIWDFEIEKEKRHYLFSNISPSSKKIAEVKEALLFVEDIDFTKTVLSSNWGKTLDSDGDISLACFEKGLISIEKLSAKEQVRYFKKFLEQYPEHPLRELFVSLCEEAKIKCLCILAKENKLSNLHLKGADVKKGSLLYLVIRLFKSCTPEEHVEKFNDFINNIGEILKEEDKAIKEGKIQYFSLGHLLQKNCFERTNKNKYINIYDDQTIPFYCEGQFWTKEKTVFCPTSKRKCKNYRYKKPMYIQVSEEQCCCVHPDINLTPENWTLGEILDWINLFNQKIIEGAFGKNTTINYKNIIGKISGLINHCNEMLDHMRCRKCHEIMEVDYRYAKEELGLNNIVKTEDIIQQNYQNMFKLYPYATSAITVVSCKHKEAGHDHGIYLNYCSGHCGNIIDNRKDKIKEVLNFIRKDGFYLCLECGSGSSYFKAGSICPKCGSYNMATNNGKHYKCMNPQCHHEIELSKNTIDYGKNVILCPYCYPFDPGNNPHIDISSDDGIHFHCNKCNNDFIKIVPEGQNVRNIGKGIKQVLRPKISKI